MGKETTSHYLWFSSLFLLSLYSLSFIFSLSSSVCSRRVRLSILVFIDWQRNEIAADLGWPEWYQVFLPLPRPRQESCFFFCFVFFAVSTSLGPLFRIETFTFSFVNVMTRQEKYHRLDNSDQPSFFTTPPDYLTSKHIHTQTNTLSTWIHLCFLKQFLQADTR